MTQFGDNNGIAAAEPAPVQSAPVSQPAPYGQPAPAGPNGWAVPPASPGWAAPNAAGAPIAFTTCRYCGSVPAADVTLRRHRGFLIMMTNTSIKGPFCRDCGTAVFRSATAATLVQGWWGIVSLIVAPITIVENLIAMMKVRNLAAPQQTPPGRQPMAIGKPLYQRWQIVGLIIPLLVAMFLVFAIVSSIVNQSTAATS